MSEKTCEIVKDLMPLTIEGICSNASKSLVEGHIALCEPCAQAYQDMQSQTPAPVPLAQSDLTFGRAFKQMLRALRVKNVLIGIVLTVVLAVVVISGYEWLFMYSSRMVSPEKIAYSLSQTSEGAVLQTFATKEGYNSVHTSSFGEKDILYIGLYRPIIYLESGVKSSNQLYYNWSLKDGVLYQGGEVIAEETDDLPVWDAYKDAIEEIRVGEPGNYITVYRQGDEIAPCTPEDEAIWKGQMLSRWSSAYRELAQINQSLQGENGVLPVP